MFVHVAEAHRMFAVDSLDASDACSSVWVLGFRWLAPGSATAPVMRATARAAATPATSSSTRPLVALWTAPGLDDTSWLL